MGYRFRICRYCTSSTLPGKPLLEWNDKRHRNDRIEFHSKRSQRQEFQKSKDVGHNLFLLSQMWRLYAASGTTCDFLTKYRTARKVRLLMGLH